MCIAWLQSFTGSPPQKQRSESDELRSFEHVYEHVPLGPPDAATIRKLRDFQGAAITTCYSDTLVCYIDS
jgi:hypothetical protein